MGVQHLLTVGSSQAPKSFLVNVPVSSLKHTEGLSANYLPHNPAQKRTNNKICLDKLVAATKPKSLDMVQMTESLSTIRRSLFTNRNKTLKRPHLSAETPCKPLRLPTVPSNSSLLLLALHG